MRDSPTFESATDDPDEFTGSVSTIVPGVEVTAHGARGFHAEVVGLALPDVRLMRVRGHGLRVIAGPSRDYLTLNVPLAGSFEIREPKARHFSRGQAYVSGSGRRFDLCSNACSTLVMNVDLQYLRGLGSNLTGGRESPRPRAGTVLNLRHREGGRLWRALSGLWSEATRTGETASSRLASREAGESVACDLLLAADDWWPSLRSGESIRDDRRRLRRVEEWIAENLDEPISRAVLCEVGGLDVRALSRAFRSRHDMGPMQYVRARRLEAVNRALVGAERGETTVTDVAMTYGFHHLSRFADDYRQEFGELPSDTLGW